MVPSSSSSCHPTEGKEDHCQSLPSLQSLNGSLWALHFFPPDSPRQLIQECHVALPSYNGVLSFIPHWHALIVMWIVQWWCLSTSFKGNEMSGWVAKVWLPVDGFHFFFWRKWVNRLEVCGFQQMCQTKRPHLSLPVTPGKYLICTAIKVDAI